MILLLSAELLLVFWAEELAYFHVIYLCAPYGRGKASFPRPMRSLAVARLGMLSTRPASACPGSYHLSMHFYCAGCGAAA